MTTRPQKGFTLIELLIVIGLLAGVIAISAPTFFKKKTKVQPVVRKMQLLSKQLHQISRVQNKVFRWVIQVGDEQEQIPHSYWVESAPGDTKMMSKEEEEEKEDKDDDKGSRSGSSRNFQLDETFFKEPIVLPDGVSFFEIESIYRKEPVTSGRGYIHYFPNGMAEEAAIHIKNEERLNWTLAIHPLTGHVKLIKKNISLEDLGKRE